MDIETKRRMAEDHRLELSDSELSKVEFVKCDNLKNLLVRNGTIAVFKEPIYIAPGIRLSPLYPQVGVCEGGVTYNRKTLQIIKKYDPTRLMRYCLLKIPINSGKGTFSIRNNRVIASAWVYNPDPTINFIVNHLDGIKHNDDPLNLEWTTYKGNVDHAFDSNLNTCNLSCFVRDSITKVVNIYGSTTRAAMALGVSQTNMTYQLSKTDGSPRIIKNRYEVKFITDKTPWTYSNKETPPPSSKFRIDVEYPDKAIESYWNVSDFDKLFNGKPSSQNIDFVINLARYNYPELKFTVVKRFESRILQALNLKTQEVFETSNYGLMQNHISRNKGFVRRVVIYGKTLTTGDFLVRVKSDRPWESPEPTGYRRIKAELININSQEVTVVSSIREIVEITGIDKKTVRKYLKTSEVIKGYKMNLLEDNVR